MTVDDVPELLKALEKYRHGLVVMGVGEMERLQLTQNFQQAWIMAKALKPGEDRPWEK